jgi:hypothetical protein
MHLHFLQNPDIKIGILSENAFFLIFFYFGFSAVWLAALEVFKGQNKDREINCITILDVSFYCEV